MTEDSLRVATGLLLPRIDTGACPRQIDSAGMKWLITIIGSWLMVIGGEAQTFTLQRQTDSLYVLTLTTDSTRNQWRLPYPVYRMETGDVDGNGTIEALVGVIKPTRFYPEMGRRLFIFKNYEGLVRPMWLGSKLGGTLQDFHFRNECVRSLETNAKGEYTVTEYRWSGFGVAFERYLIRNVSESKAREVFEE